MKKILIVIGFCSLNLKAQLPVVDLLNALIEGIENVGQVGELIQKHNANSTEKKGVQNQRRILLQLQKINKLRRTINPIIQKSELSDITQIMRISETLSTDLSDYLDLQGVDELTGYGAFDTDLSNINVNDWFTDTDYDIIEKLSTENSFEENLKLLDNNYKKKNQKFAAKFGLQAAIGKYQGADQCELRAVEMDNLLKMVKVSKFIH